MVAGGPVLARNPVLPPAQDYAALKAEAIAIVQRLCPDWTDFNAHDPGITLIELLCFALTDLGYRAGLPVEALLNARVEDLIPSPLAATPPVTADDFRRLLLDQVEGLGNVWLNPSSHSGLWDIRLHARLPLPGVHPERAPAYHRLVQRTRREWERHRPLCEDIGSIKVLHPRRTVVRARIRIEQTAQPEAILAQALFRIALTLAPEPRRSAPDISGDKPSVVDTDTLWERIADVPGVLGVDDLRLWVENMGSCVQFNVAPDEYCCLDGEFEQPTLPIEVEQDGHRCHIDRAEILRQLLRLWTGHRTRPPLKAWHAEMPALPASTPRSLNAFAPLGPQLPRVYGLASGTPETSAARQLHGFLALFEGTMRKFCEQLGGLKSLGATRGAKIEPRWLDLLLALRGVAPPPGALALTRQTAAKRALLDAHATLAQRRGRGFDPEARTGPRRLAGPELRMRLMLGQEVRITLVEHIMLRPRIGSDRPENHGITVSAVVAGAGEDRTRITAMLREELPVHIGLDVHFVDGPRWRRFYHVHRLWRSALRLDEVRAADELAVQLCDMLEGWTG